MQRTGVSTSSLRAKRSNPESFRGTILDCFVASLLAMTSADTAPRSRGAMRPRFAGFPRPLWTEGAGKTGCPLHPRSRVQIAQKKPHTSIQVQPTASRPSLRSGLTAYTALSLETNSSCLHRPRIDGEASARSGDVASAKLDCSNGSQDHTVLPYAACAVRLARCNHSRKSPCGSHLAPTPPASTASHPAFVTIATRPSYRDETRTIYADSEFGKSKIFLPQGIDRFCGDLPVGHTVARRAPENAES